MVRKRTSSKTGWLSGRWGYALGRTVLIVASLAALTFGLLDLADTALGSEMFIVEDVSVEGNCMIPEEEILKALDIPAVVYLWQIDPQLLEMRVMKLAGIRVAKVERVFPKTLSVSVEERTPLVDCLEKQTGKLFAVDEEGVILGESKDLEESGGQAGVAGWEQGHRPLLTGLMCDNWEVGDSISGHKVREILKALSLSLARKNAWVQSIEELRAPTDSRGWIVQCLSASGGIYVGESNFVERFGRIAPTLSFLDKEGIEVQYVDLRFDDQGVLIKPTNCDPDHWVEVASKFPEPERGREPV